MIATVKELIERLLKLPWDATPYIRDPNDGMVYGIQEVDAEPIEDGGKDVQGVVLA